MNGFQKGMANFSLTGLTGESGPHPEVVLNIPDGPDRKGPFHLISNQYFRNFWQWKAPTGSLGTSHYVLND